MVRSGVALVVVGLVAALVGWWMAGPEPVFGENILAGLLVVAGEALAALGVLLALVGLVRGRHRLRHR